jgi:hypothetical protein
VADGFGIVFGPARDPRVSGVTQQQVESEAAAVQRCGCMQGGRREEEKPVRPNRGANNHTQSVAYDVRPTKSPDFSAPDPGTARIGTGRHEPRATRHFWRSHVAGGFYNLRRRSDPTRLFTQSNTQSSRVNLYRRNTKGTLITHGCPCRGRRDRPPRRGHR